MKTIILWRRKRTRTFKQVRLATADGSACTIRTFWQMAQRSEGTLAIVDAPTAAHARAAIAAHLAKAKLDIGKPGITGSHGGERVITLGTNAMLAIAGASESHPPLGPAPRSRWQGPSQGHDRTGPTLGCRLFHHGRRLRGRTKIMTADRTNEESMFRGYLAAAHHAIAPR
jgi:hypothetical protein